MSTNLVSLKHDDLLAEVRVWLDSGAPGTGHQGFPVLNAAGHLVGVVTRRQLLDTLPERERTIVELRFYAGLSQSEIADQVGVSQVHVSRLLRSSLTALQRAAGDRLAD